MKDLITLAQEPKYNGSQEMGEVEIQIGLVDKNQNVVGMTMLPQEVVSKPLVLN